MLAGVLSLFVYKCIQLLSRNPLFFYSSGMTVGVLASVLVVVYILSRLMPTVSNVYDCCFCRYNVKSIATLWITGIHLFINFSSIFFSLCLCLSVLCVLCVFFSSFFIIENWCICCSDWWLDDLHVFSKMDARTLSRHNS